ncbi:ATP-binding cassette domain-containing protein [Corynebacterium cystitidis]|uniref:Energy-coupling factor transport system ATP-binding protein n=1 Tax=Corynebacterium cystitidis DSM 20524 TaxID=1121357 RepID=A0A1H9UTM3_9CORY|nr:ATP-binding cassette domain-containing protein [Corynebacterium cystitidis]WJY83716.1 Putative HMP/thiamine import ATP-binding protein YkoD [Corynebacterium cystitidis DSM 20524]SES12835.1 energy-coupling factor transport system ATP-binding protein [Corynebacterium cystitidis DSM 20524]SNV91177.1 ABC transporter ATP-binding protein [Corynebacterium cystitidis]
MSAESGRVAKQWETSRLKVHYLNNDQWVLGGVDAEALVGQVTAVVGPSGCGKTTLIRTICGLIPHCLPTEYSGEAVLAGCEVADASIEFLAGQVAYVGQNPDAAVVMRNVFDEVAFALRNLCVPAEEIKVAVLRALAQVGLEQELWDSPWDLSGGQRQRLAVAAALVTQPKLLVLDEPVANIDPVGRQEFYALLRQINADGVGIVMIDHDLSPLVDLCDQIVALRSDGTLLASGAPEVVFRTYRQQLIDEGVWIPEQSSQDDWILHSDRVRYMERNEGQWQEVDAIDTTGGGESANLNVQNFRVLGRSPAVALRLKGGECLSLLGINGSGKTSLLHAIAGLLPHEAEEADVSGKTIACGKHHVGLIFQNPEHQMVTPSVKRELTIQGLSDAEADQLLKDFDLEDHATHHPLTLSGGQMRRLSVATIVADKHKVILLDEPTYGQDQKNTEELLALIHHLQDNGHSIVMATHDLKLAREHSTHLVVLPERTVEHARKRLGQPPTEPALNPFTIFLAIIPLIVALFTVRAVELNFAVLGCACVAMFFSKVTLLRKIFSAVGALFITGLLWLLFTFQYDLVGQRVALYDYGPEAVAATAIGASLALVLLSGMAATPEAFLSALTTTWKMPYRITAAATAAVMFTERFYLDFRLLRTARALRGIGNPLSRWFSSFLPLAILAVQHAERVSLSMDSRGFGAFKRSTQMLNIRWRLRDWLIIIAACAVAAGIIILGGIA